MVPVTGDGYVPKYRIPNIIPVPIRPRCRRQHQPGQSVGIQVSFVIVLTYVKVQMGRILPVGYPTRRRRMQHQYPRRYLLLLLLLLLTVPENVLQVGLVG